tara:strand:+ start:292 stop:588 length:297 start_codon:yes stop_codon:yes gene_type:complete
MAQIPPAGAPRRDTIISDHLIENQTVDVVNSLTGSCTFTKEHRFIPAVVLLKIENPPDPHNNVYLTEVTKTGLVFKSSEEWTGKVMLRVISLQNEYLI